MYCILCLLTIAEADGAQLPSNGRVGSETPNPSRRRIWVPVIEEITKILHVYQT